MDDRPAPKTACLATTGPRSRRSSLRASTAKTIPVDRMDEDRKRRREQGEAPVVRIDRSSDSVAGCGPALAWTTSRAGPALRLAELSGLQSIG